MFFEILYLLFCIFIVSFGLGFFIGFPLIFAKGKKQDSPSGFSPKKYIIFLSILIYSSVFAEETDFSNFEPVWKTKPLKIAIPEMANAEPIFEFSRNGHLLLIRYENFGKADVASWEKTKKYIYDFNINKLIDDGGKVQEILNDSNVFFPGYHKLNTFFKFSEVLTPFDFNNDFSICFRVVKIDNVEFGDLFCLKTGKTNIWQRNMFPHFENSKIIFAAIIEKETNFYIVLSPGGQEGIVLNGSNGNLLNKFTFGHIETSEEMVQFKKKFKVNLDDGDPSLKFCSYTFSFEKTKRILVCGAFWGRRIRAISLDLPFPTLFEANSNDNPWLPKGGVWQVQSVNIIGGKFLIVQYQFAGRRTSLVFQPTEIFDLDSKKLIWRENSIDIKSVFLSADGKKIGFVRNGILETGKFNP